MWRGEVYCPSTVSWSPNHVPSHQPEHSWSSTSTRRSGSSGQIKTEPSRYIPLECQMFDGCLMCFVYLNPITLCSRRPSPLTRWTTLTPSRSSSTSRGSRTWSTLSSKVCHSSWWWDASLSNLLLLLPCSLKTKDTLLHNLKLHKSEMSMLTLRTS